jgi:hypothetical protein
MAKKADGPNLDESLSVRKLAYEKYRQWINELDGLTDDEKAKLVNAMDAFELLGPRLPPGFLGGFCHIIQGDRCLGNDMK